MMKQGRFIAVLFLTPFLSGCVSSLWTGASVVYDRHNLYKKWNDFQLANQINLALYKDKRFKRDNCSLDVAVFNGDVLLAGQVPNLSYKQEAEVRVKNVGNYRRLFNQIKVSDKSLSAIQDSWLTTKIRARIMADSSINPRGFKIITVGSVVYLMGDVQTKQAKKIIKVARTTDDVVRVVTMFRYLVYKNKDLA